MGILTNVVRQVMAWELSTKDLKLKTMSVFSVDEKTAEKILIRAKSELNREAAKNAKRKMVFLPQCMRAQGCKAAIGENGYECRLCNPACQVFKIKKMVDKSVPVFIMPGGTIVFKVIAREKPGAVFGVACFHELEMAFDQCDKTSLPAVAVPLLRDGCVNTLADMEEVEAAFKDAGIFKKQE